MAATPPICDFGTPAPDFELPDPAGVKHRLSNLRGANGTLVAFICNHCPYVKSIIDRLIRDANELEAHGVSTVAICSNDASNYPEDAPAKMAAWAAAKAFPFPYLVDESQEVARAFGAVCTPDFFGYNGALELQYRGRLDESKTQLVADARRDLFEAMVAVAKTGQGPKDQIASMGCSIKWKVAA